MKRLVAFMLVIFATLVVATDASPLSQPLYVNMRDSGPYRLGRYVDGLPNPVGPIATSRCGLWAPSPVKVGSVIYLYAAECTSTRQNQGWYRLVRFTSYNGGLTFGAKATVMQFSGQQFRMPLVLYDRGRYHLWYSRDRNGKLAVDLMYAMSMDGLHFTVPARKYTAGLLTAISPAFAFRNDGAWWMLIEGYSPDYKRAQPHLLRFGSTFQTSYPYYGPVVTDNPTGKIDASFVCKETAGWQGLFVPYGDPLGRERTMAFRSDQLVGPWKLVSDPEVPVLSFQNGSSLMHSVENPARAQTSAELPVC